MRRNFAVCGLLGTLVGVVAALPAAAMTIDEALIAAYQTNPDLKRERSNLKAAAERVGVAVGAQRPSLTGDGSIGRSRFESDLLPASIGQNSVSLKPVTGRVRLDQPVYAGGGIEAGINAAEADLGASKSLVTAREQVVLRTTANAYVDVLLNGAIVDLNDKNVEVLRKQKEATESRREAGVLTPTDVAQADARLARAVTGRVEADVQFQAARHRFEEVTGIVPGKLEPMKFIPKLPKSLEEALEIAQSNHPSLISAQANARGREYGVDVARSSLLPRLSLQGEYTYLKENDRPNGRVEEAVAQVALTIPFYQGGAGRARLRESKYLANAARLDVELVRRQVVSAVRGAWSRLTASRAAIKSAKAQKAASEKALEGVRREAKLGSRTTLDVLDAEQELLEAEVTLTQAKMEEVRAIYDTREAIGNLTVAELGLETSLYNPTSTLNNARSTLFSTDVELTPLDAAR